MATALRVLRIAIIMAAVPFLLLAILYKVLSGNARYLKYLKLWRFYFNPELEKTPGWQEFLEEFDNWERFDCSFWQAFGRGTWDDNELYARLMPIRKSAGRIPRKRDLYVAGSHDLRVFERLEAIGFRPGLSNVDMAREYIRLFHLKRHHGFMQWEVAYGVFQLDRDFYASNRQFIVTIWPDNPKYFNTRHVKRASVRLMRKLGLSHPLEVAYHGMFTRCLPIIWRCGARPIPHECPIREDPESEQPWTRSEEAWWDREKIGRLFYIAAQWLSFMPPNPPKPRRAARRARA